MSVIKEENSVGIKFGHPKNTKFNEENFIRNLENESEQSNSLMYDSINPVSEKSSYFTRTFTAMLGKYHGISLEDIDELMKSEKELMDKFQKSIENISEVLKDSSNKKIQMDFQNDKKDFTNISGNLEIPLNISRDISENNELGNNFHTSGIKLGDNYELPIILDSEDDFEADIIEIDSDDEEIKEVKKLMSLDDTDCIEIGRSEFEEVVNSKKGEISDDGETDEEAFIPIAPCPEGSLLSKKRRRGERIKAKSARRKISFTSSTALIPSFGNDSSQWRTDLPKLPYIKDHVLRTWATGFLCYRKEWERLEYLGDKVLMFCVLRFAAAKYLQSYSISDIKYVTCFLVSNKLLAAYSLTLDLAKQNQMQQLGITKKVADAFEAYIGAYFLSDGEEATTRYLEQLMSPLFDLVLTNMKNGRSTNKMMHVSAKYFNMGFLTKIPKLSK